MQPDGKPFMALSASTLQCQGYKTFEVFTPKEEPNTSAKLAVDITYKPKAKPMKRSDSDYKYQCKYCGKWIRTNADGKVHERIHTGERPYKCPICEKTFSDPSSFRNHKRVHTKETPYQCKICLKAFTQSCNLWKHQRRIHFGEQSKKYPCDICGREFRKDHLEQHKLTHSHPRNSVPKSSTSSSSAASLPLNNDKRRKKTPSTSENPQQSRSRCYTCECTRNFRKSTELKAHRETECVLQFNRKLLTPLSATSVTSGAVTKTNDQAVLTSSSPAVSVSIPVVLNSPMLAPHAVPSVIPLQSGLQPNSLLLAASNSHLFPVLLKNQEPSDATTGSVNAPFVVMLRNGLTPFVQTQSVGSNLLPVNPPVLSLLRPSNSAVGSAVSPTTAVCSIAGTSGNSAVILEKPDMETSQVANRCTVYEPITPPIDPQQGFNFSATTSVNATTSTASFCSMSYPHLSSLLSSKTSSTSGQFALKQEEECLDTVDFRPVITRGIPLTQGQTTPQLNRVLSADDKDCVSALLQLSSGGPGVKGITNNTSTSSQVSTASSVAVSIATGVCDSEKLKTGLTVVSKVCSSDSRPSVISFVSSK